MKKKREQSEEASPGQESADYVVGQVSGSLFQENSTGSGSGSGSSLSALFCSAAPAGPLVFQPAPKFVQKNPEPTEPQKESPEVKGQSAKKKKQLQEKTEAEQKLENREMSLQNADEAEEGQETATKKKKRKAAEMAAENDVEHWVMKRQKMKARKQEEATKRSRTVFVGNLPINCTKKMLQSLFKDDGPIESVRFRSVVREDPSMSRKVAVIQRKVHPQKQSVNAYLVFKDEEGVANALERNGMEIETDFHIRVDRVTDSSAHDHKRSVFVGNLSFEIKELALRRHFEDCGQVEAVRLVRDQNSGLGKGFGYVLFENSDSVQLALKLEGTKLEGRAVRVKRSMKKDKLKAKTESKGFQGRGARDPKGNTRPVGGDPARGAGQRGRGPTKGPGRERGGGPGGFKPQRKFSGTQQIKGSGSFKGEMVDPNKKMKKKGVKKKVKPNKTVHI